MGGGSKRSGAIGASFLRRVAQACKDFGQRVQKSVFECRVGQKEWAALRHRLLSEIKPDEDSLRFYYLDEKAVQRIPRTSSAGSSPIISRQPRKPDSIRLPFRSLTNQRFATST